MWDADHQSRPCIPIHALQPNADHRKFVIRLCGWVQVPSTWTSAVTHDLNAVADGDDDEDGDGKVYGGRIVDGRGSTTLLRIVRLTYKHVHS